MYLRESDKISFNNAFVVVSVEEETDLEGELPDSEEGPPKKRSCEDEVYVKAL